MLSVISCDYHSHHSRCGHAIGEMRDYIDAARASGVAHFGVSDHAPAYWLPGDHAKPRIQMAVSELPAYVSEARALQAEFAGEIEIRVGIEADFIPGRETDLARLLSSQRLDYVLGSVHYIGGRSIFDASRWADEADADRVYAAYYSDVCDAARSGLFDILAHATAVEAYGPPISESVADDCYGRVADAARDSGLVVEINTSGYRKRPQDDQPFPNARLLEKLVERNVPLTFGSDCHHPGQVLFGAEKVSEQLSRLGIVTEARAVGTARGTIQAWRRKSNELE